MKPPYRVPSMAEIAALPWNGLKVASTFSGCGGSCTGYRMAGYRVVWANEFVPAAQASYKANAAPDCILDTRDIRTVTAEDILAATGLKRGELDLFDGSPPCASFSTAGKREAGWGKVKAYSDTKQRTDDLFAEYVRILNGLQPKVFVAENVSGLVKGTAKGMFLQILAALKGCGYRVTCRVLDAQWLGVPQQRQRTIFVGVREDLGIDPVHPKPLAYRYSVRDALPWITKATHDTRFSLQKQAKSQGDGFKSRDVTNEPCATVTIGNAGSSPNPNHYQVEAETRMAPCYQEEWDKMKVGEQSKKFFSLIKVNPEAPSPTVDTSAMRASVCHPTEKRKFTIAELRRICAFPDDFILCGSYAQQWERLGRSVPPVMMSAVAATIRDEILRK